MRWLFLKSYHSLALLTFMGILAVILAWTSYDLLTLAMANASYLTRFGLMAALDGGLLQLAVIFGQGLICLLSYLGFKGIEHELTDRWRGTKGH